MTLPTDLDEAFAMFEAKNRAFEAACAALEAAQAQGRMAVPLYEKVAALHKELTVIAATLLPRIEEARRSMS